MVSVIKINYNHTRQYDVFFRPDYSRKNFEINSEQFKKKYLIHIKCSLLQVNYYTNEVCFCLHGLPPLPGSAAIE